MQAVHARDVASDKAEGARQSASKAMDKAADTTSSLADDAKENLREKAAGMRQARRRREGACSPLLFCVRLF